MAARVEGVVPEPRGRGRAGSGPSCSPTPRSSRCRPTPERVERGDPRRCARRRCSPAGAAARRSTSRRPRALAAATGELLLEAELALIELNPVLVHEQGVTVVDALAHAELGAR